MKKQLLSILLALCILTVTSCSTAGLSTEYEPFDEWPLTESTPSVVLPPYDRVIAPEDQPYDKLITKSVDIHAFVQKYCSRRYYDGRGTLAEVSNEFGVECLRSPEESPPYSVHKVKQGGLLYVFYYSFNPIPTREGVLHWFYVKKNLSHDDFDSIQVGSTIDDVKHIDPVTQVYENLFVRDIRYNNFPTSSHYLRDGILEIDYKYVDGEFQVVSQHFFNNFHWCELEAGKTIYYDLKLFAIDRI